MAYHPYFESTTMAVIVSNAVWIGVDTELNHKNLEEDGKLPLEPWSLVVENLFCFYFTGELVIRFLAFKSKRRCFFNAWFVFDSILVGCMILETWIMPFVEAFLIDGEGGGVGPLSALRLLRLLRLARVGRLMKFVPELGKLVKGMVKAARSVGFILLFLILVIYVFAIIFTGMMSDREKFPLTPSCEWEVRHFMNESDGCLGPTDFGETGQDLFGTMGDSFMTLFTRGVLGDNLDETVDAIVENGDDTTRVILMWVWFLFLIITFATLLNMLIGVVCDVISQAAEEEEESDKVSSLTATITDAFQIIDTNADMVVSRSEWTHIKEDELVRRSMLDIGIENERMDERLDQFAEMLFDHTEDEMEPCASVPEMAGLSSMAMDNTGLTVTELIKKVVEIRPDQNASALDLETLQAQVMKDQKNFKVRLKRIEEGVKKTLGPRATSGLDNMPDLPDMPKLPTSFMDSEETEGESGVLLVDVPTQLLLDCLAARADDLAGESTERNSQLRQAATVPNE
jgi:voltage-gated sodium channel